MTNPKTPSTAPVAWCRSDEFTQLAQGRGYLLAFSEQHPNCDMPLYAQPQASAAPDADQAEGPKPGDIAELCAEFEYHIDSDDYHGIGILCDMITAAITRWRAHGSVAQSGVIAAIISEVDSKPGLPVALPTFTPSLPPRVGHVLRLADIIREVNSSTITVDALALAILAHPGFSGCHDGANALPAQGEVAELIAALEADAECVAAEQPDLMQLTDKQLTRIAEILKAFNMGGWIVPTVEQTTPPASEVQGVAVDRYEFSVFDSDDQEMAGGDAATLSEVVAEGRHYLRQYNQDGPHKLELRRVLVLDHSEAAHDHA